MEQQLELPFDPLEEVPTTREFAEIATLAEQQLAIESAIEIAEAKLKDLGNQLRAIAEVALPEAMRAIGVKAFALANGGKVTIKEEVYCSVRKDVEGRAFAWLRENGHGDIIKSNVEVRFGSGDDEKAVRLVAVLEREGFDNFGQKTSVHPGTLKAFAKEQLAEGRPLPDDLFSVAPINRAVIKLP